MKIIKKILIYILLSVILISLLGCSSKNKSNNYQEVTAQYKEEFLEVRVDKCETDEIGTNVAGVVLNSGNLKVDEVDVGVDFYLEGRAVGYSKTTVLNIDSKSKRVFSTSSFTFQYGDECIANIVIYPWEYGEEVKK